MPNGWPGFILQAIATDFGVEIYSEHGLYYEQVSQEEAKPSYVPLDTPTTDEEIVLMRAQSRAEREALDQELEAFLVARRGKEIAPAG